MCTDLQNNRQWWEFPLIRAHWINTMNTGLVCEIIALKMKKHSPVHLNAWTKLSCTPKTRQKTKLKKLRRMLGGVHIMEKFVIVRWSSPPLPDCKRWGEWKTANNCKTVHPFTPPPPTPHRAVAIRWQFRLETIVKRESSFEALLSRSSEKFSRISIRSFKGRFYIPASQCQHTVAAVLLMYSKT